MQLKMCWHGHVFFNETGASWQLQNAEEEKYPSHHTSVDLIPVPKMVSTLIFALIHPPPLNVMLLTDSLDSSLNKFSTVTFIFPKLYLRHFLVAKKEEV